MDWVYILGGAEFASTEREVFFDSDSGVRVYCTSERFVESAVRE